MACFLSRQNIFCRVESRRGCIRVVDSAKLVQPKPVATSLTHQKFMNVIAGYTESNISGSVGPSGKNCRYEFSLFDTKNSKSGDGTSKIIIECGFTDIFPKLRHVVWNDKH